MSSCFQVLNLRNFFLIIVILKMLLTISRKLDYFDATLPDLELKHRGCAEEEISTNLRKTLIEQFQDN